MPESRDLKSEWEVNRDSKCARLQEASLWRAERARSLLRPPGKSSEVTVWGPEDCLGPWSSKTVDTYGSRDRAGR